jgi:hypothetical protein
LTEVRKKRKKLEIAKMNRKTKQGKRQSDESQEKTGDKFHRRQSVPQGGACI